MPVSYLPLVIGMLVAVVGCGIVFAVWKIRSLLFRIVLIFGFAIFGIAVWLLIELLTTGGPPFDFWRK